MKEHTIPKHSGESMSSWKSAQQTNLGKYRGCEPLPSCQKVDAGNENLREFFESPSRSNTSAKYLLTALAIIGQMIRGVAADYIGVVIAPTTNTTGTYIPGSLDQEHRYTPITGNGKTYSGYWYLQSTVADNAALKFWDSNGILLATAPTVADPTSTAFKNSLQIRPDSMHIIFGVYTGYHYRLSITIGPSPGFAITITAQANAIRIYSTSTYMEPANSTTGVFPSTYNWVHGSQNAKLIYKFDYTTFAGITTAGAADASYFGYGRSIKQQVQSSDFLVLGGDYWLTYIHSKSNLSLVASAWNVDPGANTYFNTQTSRFCNISPLVHYYTGGYLYTGNTGHIFDLKLTVGSSTTVSTNNPKISVSDAGSAQLHNFDTYQYLVVGMEIQFYMVYKTNFTIGKTVLFQNAQKFEYLTMVPGEVVGNMNYFGRIGVTPGGTVRNFQSYYLVFDNCTNRLATEVCTNCLAGYYRNTTNPAGDCILPQHFPPLYGIDDPNIKMSHCLTGCLACLMNYQICTLCDQASGYYLHPNGTCLTSPMMPTTFGPNLGTGLVVGCQNTHCLTCNLDYTVCTLCNTTAFYYLKSPACLTFSEMPNTFGPNLGTGIVVTCSLANCIVCQNDYTVCTACGNGYYLSSGVCLLPSQLPSGQGANPTTGVATTCTQAGCVNCSASYTVCTVPAACASGTYLQTSTSSCLTPAQMPIGYGPNLTTGIVAACSLTNCGNCQNNYMTCTACSGSYYLSGGTTCLLTSQLPSGQGASIGTGVAYACLDPTCLNCSSNYTFCTLTAPCPLGSYLHPNSSCLTPAQMPPGSGPNTGTGTVVNCNDPHCINCRNDYMVCIQCDTSVNYFLYSPSCITFSQMPQSMGPNLVTGVVVTCSLSQCYNCQNNYLTCNSCGNGYYLSGGTICLLPPQLPSGQGANIGTGIAVLCTDLHCVDCSNNHLLCIACDTGSSFYLLGTSCIDPPSITPGMGINTSAGTVVNCLDSHCQTCVLDYTICVACINGSGYYLYTGNCILPSQSPSKFGANIATGIIVSCQDTNCIFCQNDYTVCTSCDQAAGYYLSGGTCLPISTLASGTGLDPVSQVVFLCQDSHCDLCLWDYQVCTKCLSSGVTYYVQSGTCLPMSSVPTGFGYNNVTFGISPCTSSHCINCQTNYSECKTCDEANNYYLQQSVCILVPPIPSYIFKLKALINPRKFEAADLSLLIDTNETISNPLVKVALFKFLENSLTIGFRFLDPQMQDENIRYKQVLKSLGAFAISTVYLETWPNVTQSTVVASSQPELYFETPAFNAKVIGFNWSFAFNTVVVRKEIETQENKGQTVATLVGSSTVTFSKWVSYFLMIVSTIDPTGMVFKFSQILKVVTKLYFININYGKRLDAFLSKIGESLETSDDPKRAYKNIYNAKSYRGKLSKKNVSLDFVASTQVLLLAYLFVWVIKVLNIWFQNQFKVKKWYLYVFYYGTKVHLIIFNLVFIDFIWLLSRTILHSYQLPAWKMFLSYLTGLLLCLDILEFLQYVYSLSRWIHYMKYEELDMYPEKKAKKKRSFRKVANAPTPTTVNTSGSILVTPRIKTSRTQEAMSPELINKPGPELTINYERTYEELDQKYFYIKSLSTNIKVDTRIIYIFAIRTNHLAHIVRVSLYMIIIVSCQYSTGFALLILLGIEVGKIYHAIHCYLKYKYLKNIICLLMEVLQSISLTLFLIICFIIHFKRFDEVIMDFYQDAGIWIVIASCVAEYLMLIIYIGVAAYEFWKNRKNTSDSSWYGRTSFIYYSKKSNLNTEKANEHLGEYSSKRLIGIKFKKGFSSIANLHIKDKFEMRRKFHRVSINSADQRSVRSSSNRSLHMPNINDCIDAQREYIESALRENFQNSPPMRGSNRRITPVWFQNPHPRVKSPTSETSRKKKVLFAPPLNKIGVKPTQ